MIMGRNTNQTDIRNAVIAIKVAIQQSRRKVMQQANRDALALYYAIGGYISWRKNISSWGDKVLEEISSQLQQEMPGLRGFAKSNLKKMCVFYNGWKSFFPSSDYNKNTVESINMSIAPVSDHEQIIIGQLSTDQFDQFTLSAFLSVQFTHHYEILQRADTLEERLFYIRKVAAEFWSVDKLVYNMREQLYLKEGTMQNNFAVTLTDEDQRKKAEKAFRKKLSI